MGNITLEQIDLIMERAHVSYTEAKEALEHCNGDTIETLLYLEKCSKFKATKNTESSSQKLTNFIDKLNATTFILKKKDRVYVDVPLSVALLAFILCLHVSLIALVLSLIFGARVQIKGENDIARKINSTLDSFHE